MSRFTHDRDEASKHRKPPLTLTDMDVIDHRFWLFMTDVAIEDLDRYTERFKKIFK